MKTSALLTAALALAISAPALAAGRATGLQATMISVADFQKSTDFYGALGMKLGAKYNSFEWELAWDDATQGSSIVMVHHKPSELASAKASFLIFVPNLQAAMDKLKALGHLPSSEKTVGPTRVVSYVDPDGNNIEILVPASR
jgi:catechol 2,3-dioxygenase-like lactoylglutathione lyase family enzyme